MDKSISNAAHTLFELTTTLEPRLGCLRAWFRHLVGTINKWYQSEGTQGIKRAKDVLNYGFTIILGESPGEPLEFVSAKDGVPKLVKPLVDRVLGMRKDQRLLSAVLSLVRVVDLYEGIPTDSTVQQALKVISESKLPGSARKVMDEFRNEFLPIFVRQQQKHPLTRATHGRLNSTMRMDESSEFLISFSRGPNGPSLMRVGEDVLSLNDALCADGTKLLDKVTNLGRCVAARQGIASNSMKYSTVYQEAVLKYDLGKPHKPIPGKLQALRDKAGKVRIIAQPDSLSQLVMRPIHRFLMAILKLMPEDCTYDQRKAIEPICRWTLEAPYLASFDQSQCTDRFPFEMQLTLLEFIQGSLLAEAVAPVMADREWAIRLPKAGLKTVRWSVGQPLGMYGSWPLMALTHHLLVQYCSWVSAGRPRSFVYFKDYVICGDDIVIANQRVAESYRKVCSRLGMKINLTKSHCTGPSTGFDSVAEFTRVIVWKGHPLHPIKPRLVHKALGDPRHAVPLLCDLADPEVWGLSPTRLKRIVTKFWPTRSKFLLPLISAPKELGGVGKRDSDKGLKSRFESFDAHEIHPWLYYIALRIESNIKLMKKPVVVAEASGPKGYMLSCESFRVSPLLEAANLVSTRLSRVRHLLPDLTTEQIAALLCTEEGRNSLQGFFPKREHETVPWSTQEERELKFQLNAWEKTLRKAHTWTQKTLGSLSRDVLSSTPHGVQDAQYEAVSAYLSMVG